jgi:NAD(P)-dependent dehydrogenase (short-subunit alcohol dehydrogenase family)
MKHEGKLMANGGRGGAILNISSLNSEVPMFGGSSYCTAKAGVAMLTKCGALELAESNIRVNAVSPGLTDTPLTAMAKQVPGMLAAYNERIPLGRAASPAEIAAASLYLTSDDASYVSGVNLFVDGAWATTGYPDLRPYMMAAAAAAGGQQ